MGHCELWLSTAGGAHSILCLPELQSCFLCSSIFYDYRQVDTLTNSAPGQPQEGQKVASSISLGTFLFFRVKKDYSNILV